ncbi:unnamed protein product [Chrysoparadoxa australica]
MEEEIEDRDDEEEEIEDKDDEKDEDFMLDDEEEPCLQAGKGKGGAVTAKGRKRARSSKRLRGASPGHYKEWDEDDEEELDPGGNGEDLEEYDALLEELQGVEDMYLTGRGSLTAWEVDWEKGR